MRLFKSVAMIVTIMVLGLCAPSAQAVSLTIGSGNYYVSVGDHDYLPYAYGAGGYQPGPINFQTAMADYGQWTSMQPFGQVWQPYVAQGWRPYTQGHWVYTQYGPTWVGYEPWAWAGYHYGNWVFSQQMGWVWIPGNTYTPGNVAWAQGYNSLGWMPMPPAGYDYSRGYLAYAGPQNQFTIGNSDFSIGIGAGNGYYQGGYDPRYQNYYYNQNYTNMAGNLWTFIEPNYFTSDNYADYYLDGNYAQQMFNQQMIRISTQPLDRVVIERIVRQPVQVRQVEVNQINVDGRPTRLVRVQGEEQDVRRNANRVVREVIAPAFAERNRTFKGPQAKGQAGLNRTLNQGEANARVETIDSNQLVQQARQRNQQQEQRRAEVRQKKLDEVQTAVKEGKIRKANTPPGQLKKEEDTRQRNSQVNPSTEQPNNRPDLNRNRPDVQSDRDQQRNNKPDSTNEDQQNRQRDNRPADHRTNENMNRPTSPEINNNTEDQQNDNGRRNRPENNEQQPPDRRANPDHSNVQPDADQNRTERENAVKNGREVPPQAEATRDSSDRNANSKDQNSKDQSDHNKKKAKPKKDKDKNNNDDEQPPPEN